MNSERNSLLPFGHRPLRALRSDQPDRGCLLCFPRARQQLGEARVFAAASIRILPPLNLGRPLEIVSIDLDHIYIATLELLC